MLNKILKPLLKVQKKLADYSKKLEVEIEDNKRRINELNFENLSNTNEKESTEKILSNLNKLLGQ